MAITRIKLIKILTGVAFIHLTMFIYCCTDIDECVESNGGCQHVCNNSVGSYRCLCDNGYSLGENKHSCEGNIYIHSTYIASYRSWYILHESRKS